MLKRTAALVAAALLVAGNASADTPPSQWDRAKQPEIADEYELHLTAQRILESGLPDDDPRGHVLNDAQRLRALAMLQAAGAATSLNPLLRFDLAKVYQELGRHPQAVETYKAAMRDFPNHPLSRQERFALAISCGHLGDHACESRMYRDIIAQATDPRELATPSLNLAEADMHDRNLREAIEGYRETFRLCNSYQSQSTPALAQWGLAVALDRAGEIHEAGEAAHHALSLAQGWGGIGLLTDRNIFFFPDYEVAWYQSVTLAAEATRAQTPKDRLANWQQAERRMALWVKGGEKMKDYWLPIAKARLATYTKERIAAEAALLKAAPATNEDASDDETSGLVVPPAPRPKGPPKPVPFKPTRP